MKKVILALLVCFCLVSVPVFADHPSGMGVGAFGGGGYPIMGGFGATAHFPGIPIFWGAQVSLGYGFGATVTGDYYFIDNDLISDSGFNLDWYLGVGGYGSFQSWNYLGSRMLWSVGVRVPIGLSWHINKNWELFTEVAPSFGFGTINYYLSNSGNSGMGFDWGFSGYFGFRYWF